MAQHIKLGAKVPNFTLKNDAGDDVTLYTALETSTNGVILFVYPKANTPGCTTQACGFRDVYPFLVEKGYQVFGLSKDKQKAQESWKQKHNLPYSLLCEAQHVLQTLGCNNGSATLRSVFIISKDGAKLCFSRIRISPAASVAETLDYINNYFKEEQLSQVVESTPDGGKLEEPAGPAVVQPLDIPQRKSARLIKQPAGTLAAGKPLRGVRGSRVANGAKSNNSAKVKAAQSVKRSNLSVASKTRKSNLSQKPAPLGAVNRKGLTTAKRANASAAVTAKSGDTNGSSTNIEVEQADAVVVPDEPKKVSKSKGALTRAKHTAASPTSSKLVLRRRR